MKPRERVLLDEAVQKASPRVVEAAARVMLSASTGAGKTAFLLRALTSLARLTEEAGERALGDAAGASSDYEVLLRALEEPSVLTALRAENPLALARLRGLQYRERLLQSEGGTISVAYVASILGLTRQAVDKRRRMGRLIGLNTGRRGYVYPIWQFGPDGSVLPGLELVLAELRGHDPWMQVAFMLNANTRLSGETPLAELRRGHVEEVRRAARAYGEQGAA